MTTSLTFRDSLECSLDELCTSNWTSKLERFNIAYSDRLKNKDDVCIFCEIISADVSDDVQTHAITTLKAITLIM